MLWDLFHLFIRGENLHGSVHFLVLLWIQSIQDYNLNSLDYADESVRRRSDHCPCYGLVSVGHHVMTLGRLGIKRAERPILFVISGAGKLVVSVVPVRLRLRIWSRETGFAVPSRFGPYILNANAEFWGLTSRATLLSSVFRD